MIILKERSERHNGIYAKDYYEDRDFLIAVTSKSLGDKNEQELLNKVSEIVEQRGVSFLGAFNTEEDIKNI